MDKVYNVVMDKEERRVNISSVGFFVYVIFRSRVDGWSCGGKKGEICLKFISREGWVREISCGF